MVKRKIAIVTASHNLQQSARQVGEPPVRTATPEENGCRVSMAYERSRDFGKTGRKCDGVNRDVITPKSSH